MTSIAHDAVAALAPTRFAAPRTAAISRRAVVAGRALSTIGVLFLGLDGAMKVAQVRAVMEGMPQLGWPAHLALPLGVLLLACTALYAIPRTAILGAVLLTGYLGGAIATHARVGSPLFSHVLFPVYVAAILWGGLWLRDARVRAISPLRA